MEKKIFSLPGGTGKEKVFRPHRERLVAKGLRFMENRHLPILHKKILLRVLGVSNESCLGVTSGR